MLLHGIENFIYKKLLLQINHNLMTSRAYSFTIVAFIPSADYFWLFCLTIFLFICLTVFFNQLLDFNLKNSLLFFFCLSLWCCLILKFPMFNFIFSILLFTVGIIPSLSFINFSYKIPFTKKIIYFKGFPSIKIFSINLIKKISFLLKKTNFLNFLELLHEKVFYKIPSDKFTALTVLSISGSISHVIANRHLLYIEKPAIPLELLYIILFFTAYFVYIRLLISLSIITINAVRNFDPTLLNSPLLRLDPLDPDNFPQNKNDYKLSSIFSFNRHNHVHNYPMPRSTGWGRATIIGGICTTIFGGISVYYLREQTFLAEKQNVIGETQNFQLERQNDLEEVSQGLETKENYLKKWKKS